LYGFEFCVLEIWVCLEFRISSLGFNILVISLTITKGKVGQGANPCIGGCLPGEKVAEDISKTRMIPKGTDALSPAL
jgi:hypothetical protein